MGESREKNILEMNHITKTFPGVRALSDVCLEVRYGEVHAVCGENGAGKSTLIKILSGIYPRGSFDGELIVEGVKKQFSNVRDSEDAGIATIYQEIELIQELSVAENIFLGRQPNKYCVIDWMKVRAEAQKALEEVGIDIDAMTKVRELGVGQQQLVEIAKALQQNARVLVLDEPTASLSEGEVDILFRIVRRLRKRNVACIYISHRLDEVFELADRVSVLRDGQYIGTKDVSCITKDELIQMMVGRELKTLFPKEVFQKGSPGFEVRHLTVYDGADKSRKIVDDVSFQASYGEILGIAGLVGAGRTEMIQGLIGALPGKVTGEVIIDGERVKIHSPIDAVRYGIGYVPEDRKGAGAVLGMSVRENITLASLKKIFRTFINGSRETSEADKYVSYLQIKTPSIEQKVENLSGGNQQKVVIGKWLLTDSRVLILDEPSRGIDIAVKAEIYKIMNELVKKGVIVIMISSELPEILGMSDRIIVMREGRIAVCAGRDEMNQEIIMKYATGSAEEPAYTPQEDRSEHK
ncbi:sugar ABC transporter ATP-binding protein [Dorea sp. D27]|uniref:sugar ABC transporter ATP-binding protein n=1 Tax=Dorea sp. D27 TaxID=658665 RepID=UPI000673AF4B|nr:ATP-binding cassette domain-containing protein [Dorea sp. D27]KMZ53702.1 xylose import ATP-binding protein XylG [Dorea sp. D27]